MAWGNRIKDRPDKKAHLIRRWLLVTIGLLLIVPAIIIKGIVEYLMRRRDPEEGEIFSEPFSEKEGLIESFDGTRLYVEEFGEGPTVILAHGFFNDSRLWHYQKKELGKEFRIITYDQRGHWRSDIPEDADYSMEALALDLRAVLDNCAPDRQVFLAGHSMGGMAVLKFTELFPEELGNRVRGVALVDASHVPVCSCVIGAPVIRRIKGPVIEPLCRWMVNHSDLADRIKNVVIRTSLFVFAAWALGFGKKTSYTHIMYVRETARVTSIKGAALSLLGMLGQEEPTSLDPLAISGMPVLIWVGRRDKLLPARVSEDMHRSLPNSNYYLIFDAGHPSNIENYGDFNEVLRGYLEYAFDGPIEMRTE